MRYLLLLTGIDFYSLLHFFFFNTGAYSVAQDQPGFTCMTLLAQLPKCYNYRHLPPHSSVVLRVKALTRACVRACAHACALTRVGQRLPASINRQNPCSLLWETESLIGPIYTGLGRLSPVSTSSVLGLQASITICSFYMSAGD